MVVVVVVVVVGLLQTTVCALHTATVRHAHTYAATDTGRITFQSVYERISPNFGSMPAQHSNLCAFVDFGASFFAWGMKAKRGLEADTRNSDVL